MKYKCAYVTLATTPFYLEGARHLYETYQAIKSKYPFFVMVLNTTDITGYEDLPIIRVMTIKPKNPNHWWYNGGTAIKKSKYNVDIFNKFNILLMSNYDYIMFLDADCFFRRNADNLMDECAQALIYGNKDMVAADISYNSRNYYASAPTEYRINGAKPKHTLNADWMFFKTSLSLFYQVLKYMENNEDEEIMLYNMWYDNILTIAWPVRRIYDYINHNLPPIDGDKYTKYWETPVGMAQFNNFLKELKR